MAIEASDFTFFHSFALLNCCQCIWDIDNHCCCC